MKTLFGEPCSVICKVVFRFCEEQCGVKKIGSIVRLMKVAAMLFFKIVDVLQHT